jgi:hypothetical protein
MKELVGKGKPFYSAVDKAAGLLKRKVGTGAEFMKELQGLGGIKQSEIEDRGLGDLMGAPKMTHEQFMSALAAKPAPAIREKVFGKLPEEQLIPIAKEMAYKQAYEESRDNGLGRSMAEQVAEQEANENYQQFLDKVRRQGGAAYHGEYTLPGGDNYREMLIKTPKGAEQFGGVSSHFGGEGDILASMRVKDRTGPNGEKLLHLEELQSDWHQQGREKGYRGKADKEYTNYLNDLQERVKQAIKQEYLASGVSDDAAESLAGKMAQRMSDDPRKLANFAGEEDKRMELNKARVDEHNLVPNAPFKKNWEEMALKRLIHHAAEKGYHGIVVTPGAEQAKRYDLSKHINDLQYDPQTKTLTAWDHSGNKVIDRMNTSEDKLADYIGKEGAQKLLAQNPQDTHVKQLFGADLQVGGEGMKGFYDKKVPNILNAIGKKHGVKTHLHGHYIETEPARIEEQLAAPGVGHFPEPIVYPAKTVAVHHFPITEEMRKDVLTNGLPLHREGGIIRKAVGGQVQPSINQMRMALLANGKSAFGDIQNVGANEAPNMDVKAYINPDQKRDGIMPVGGVSMGNQPLPVGGVDMSKQQGQQLMPPNATPPQGQPQGAPEGGMPPMPPSMGAPNPLQQPQSNILQMTPQGQAMSALKPSMPPPPQGMADGGLMNMGNMPSIRSNTPSVPQFSQGGLEPHPLPTVIKDPNSMDRPPVSNENMDNGATNFTIDNFQQLAKGGSAHYEPSPVLRKADIDMYAERMARQMAGLENPNQKTIKQLAREQDLPIDIRSKKKMDVPVINYEDLVGASTVGVPGDPSRGGVVPSKRNLSNAKAGETLHAIGGEKLEHPVPLYGGKDYGAYGHSAGWASDLGASAGLFNVVKRLAEENPNSKVLGHYHKMTPESLNHAVHMLDAVISHHRPHEVEPEHLATLNHLMRKVKTTSSKHDVPYPEFPGFENPADVMLHGAINSGMRKKLIGLLSTEKYFPGGKQKMNDIVYALSHPELRNVETGAGGSAILEFDPTKELKESISPHPTYAHDIPSKLIGRTKYTTPAEILAPRSMHNARKEIAAMGKKVVPFNQAKMNIIREPIDQQYINQMGEYEQAMKKRLGYKKGGNVSMDQMQATLTLKPKKAK